MLRLGTSLSVFAILSQFRNSLLLRPHFYLCIRSPTDFRRTLYLCHVPEPVRVNRFRRQHSGANPSGRHQHPGSARADGRARQRFRRSGSQPIRDEYCHR